MVSQARREDIERRIAVCQEYAALWQEFFTMFGTADFAERRILEQDEAHFAKVVTQLAEQCFRFCFYMGDKFGDGDKIIDILERAEGLRVLQEMPEANFSKLEVDWHTVFINMHRAVGRLMRELPPEESEEEVDAKGKKKGKKATKTPPPTAAPPRPAAAPRPTAPRQGAPAPPKIGAPRPSGVPPRPKGP